MAKHPTSCWLKPLTNSSKRRWNVMSAQSQKGNPALRASAFGIAGVTLLADFSGALFWEEQGLLVVSDLHLEKGSSFAARGVLLPPYDTARSLVARVPLPAGGAGPADVSTGKSASRQAPPGAAGESPGPLHPKARVPT